VGATDTFIRLPFFVEGFLLGLLIILVLGVFVFCHFGFLARRPRGQPELNN